MGVLYSLYKAAFTSSIFIGVNTQLPAKDVVDRVGPARSCTHSPTAELLPEQRKKYQSLNYISFQFFFFVIFNLIFLSRAEY